MVLTHLILNGMIKVKGQLGEMAKCLEDEDERIADLAKLFFSELSTKDNAIYNNLPDGECDYTDMVLCLTIPHDAVISHLSVGAHAVDETVFQSTMKFIFNFIEKVSRSIILISDRVAERRASRRSKRRTSSKNSANASG